MKMLGSRSLSGPKGPMASHRDPWGLMCPASPLPPGCICCLDSHGANKQETIDKLTTLEEDGGDLKGGVNKDTYDHKMKQKVKKKLEKKEKATAAEHAKKEKKKTATLKMIATKLKKKQAKEAAEKAATEGAAASSFSAGSAHAG